MHIGIDIGGTFTDAVLLDGFKIIASTKIQTENNLSNSVKTAITQLIKLTGVEAISRIVISTTLITNFILKHKKINIALILFPGPGADPYSQPLAGQTAVVRGSVDFRGRIIEPIDEEELANALNAFSNEGIREVAVACKFAQRNPTIEKQVRSFIKKKYPEMSVILSSDVHSTLNWICRANGAVFQMLTANIAKKFYFELENYFNDLSLHCPIHILKSDGGTLPLSFFQKHPLEGIFSGPAASVHGVLAMAEHGSSCIVADVGGTTVDFGLLLDGKPLVSQKNASINEYPLPIKAMETSSISIGGDSAIIVQNGMFHITQREGPALCLGGPVLTITDILVYKGLSSLKLNAAVKEAIDISSAECQTTPSLFADMVIEYFLDTLERTLDKLLIKWAEEPAYRVWQYLQNISARPDKIAFIGGPAKAMVKLWGNRKGLRSIEFQYPEIANAIGAAFSKTTLHLDFFADTQRNYYSTNLGAEQGKLPISLNNLHEAKEYCYSIFQRNAEIRGIDANDYDTLYEESFNIIDNWQTCGKIFQIGMQTLPGLDSTINKKRRSTDA